MRYRPIRRNNEFGRVYARGKSYVNQALVLYVLKTRGKRTRVGLTATKKIGHAVQRNRARRVMKAAIDEHLDYNIGGYDLVFVARGMTPRLKSWQLSSIVAKLFAQAGLPDKAKQPDAPLPATLPPGRHPAYFAVPFRKKIAASAPGVVYWVQTVLFFQTIHLKFTAFSNSCIKIKSYTEL